MEYFDFEIEDDNGDLFASLFPSGIDSYAIERDTSDFQQHSNPMETNIVIANGFTDEVNSAQCTGQNLCSTVPKKNPPENDVTIGKRHNRSSQFSTPIVYEVVDLSCNSDGESSNEPLPNVFSSLPSGSSTSGEETVLRPREKSPPNYILGRKQKTHDPVIADEKRVDVTVTRDEEPDPSPTLFLANATKSHMQKYFMRRKKTSPSPKPEGTSPRVQEEDNKPKRTIRRRKKPKATYVTKKMRNEKYKYDSISDSVLKALLNES